MRNRLLRSRHGWAILMGLLLGALLLLSACRLPHITIVLQPAASVTPAARPPAGPNPTFAATQAASAPAATPPPTPRAAEAPGTPSPTPSPIPHLRRPGEPVLSERVWDATCRAGNAPIVPPRGDDYFVNLYERPFNAETQDTYYPELDIRRADIGTDGTWLYVVLELNGGALPAEPTAYGVELDLDIDGRGDWLLWAQSPLGTTWQVEGVALYRDLDDDVGEVRACRNDPPQDGTSYEDQVFVAGQGLDPDAAWARWVPRGRPQVQFALLYDIIERDPAFMWWVWSDRQVQRPDWMDYHDHYTAEEAGSPFPPNPYFPARALARLDNTCHWVFGFQPTGNEPCICAGNFPTPTATPAPTATPTITPTPQQGARITGVFYKDRNDNGRYDPGEGVSSITVVARRGACGSPMGVGDTAVSGADGSFVLNVPAAGPWCVMPSNPTIWDPPRQQVNAPPGGTAGPVYFRFKQP